MISHILLAADLDPTISVGGILKAIGGNIRVGKSETFITEACEYTNSFLHFYPKISVILNIEEDHLDFFKDLEDIRHSFHQFAALLPSDGTLIINGDIDNYQEIYEGLDCNVITYGSSDMLDYSAANITYDEKGLVAFDLIKNRKAVDHIQDYILQAFSVPAAPHRFETCGVFPSLLRVTESLLFPSSPAFYAPPPLCMTPFSAKTFLCLRFRQIFFVLFSSSLQKSFISCTHSGHNFSVY